MELRSFSLLNPLLNLLKQTWFFPSPNFFPPEIDRTVLDLTLPNTKADAHAKHEKKYPPPQEMF